MPEYLTEADLVQQPQSDFLTEADLVAPVKVGKKVVKKKVAKPSVGALREQAAGAKAPADTGVLEGHDWEVEGGQPQIQLQVKPSTSLDFRSPEVSLTTTTPKLKLTPTQAKRREGESFDEFNIRASQFESVKRQQEAQAKAERAAVRSKVSPKTASMLPEAVQKYSPSPLQLLTGSDLSSAKGASLAQGVENVLAPLIRQGGLAAGIGPEETWAQGMPHLNEEESKNRGNKIVEGIGSTLPYGIASALGGMPATALLGASSNAAQTYEEALANGVSHDQALQAAIPGAIIGSLEGLMGLGTGKFVEQMGKGTVKSLALGIGEEEFQELTSQVLNNVNAKMLSGYDPNRAISEGMWDTFVTTLGTAGLTHGATLVEGGHTKATQALENLPPAQQLEVGTALADPSPKAFASLSPRVREAALLNWQMEAHHSLKEADGRPKIFYHGTPAGEFDFFDPSADENIGSHFGSQRASNMFSDSGDGTTYPVYLNIKNPVFTPDIYPVYDLRSALENSLHENGQPVFNRQEIEEIVNKSPDGGNSYEDETDVDKALGHSAWRKTYQSIADANPQLNKYHPMDQEKLKVLAASEIKKADPSYFGVQKSIASPSQLFKAALESKGFDGIQYVNQAEDPGHTSHIAFYPHQVKSAFAQEFDPNSVKLSASFLPTELQQMEQRALKAGKPVALRPETRDAYVARNQEIKQQLMTLDPASPDFAKLADEHTRLARAIDDAPDTVPESTEALRKHLVEKNLGHEGAADEMLRILRPSEEGTIKDRPVELAARFYPNKTSDTKGGTVYLSPEALGNLFIESEGSRSGIGALNENVDKVREVAASVAETDPALSQSLLSAADEAERKGLSQVSLISYRQGQGLPETRKLIRHESFHTGQWGALDQAGEGPDIRALHAPDVIYHPVLTKMASSEIGQQVLNYYEGDHDALATELAAYSAAGQYDLFGLNEADAASYLTDYLTGIAETHGPEALDALAGTARLSPIVAQKVKEISSESKPKNFGQANRDFAAQLRAQPSASGGVEGIAGSSEDSGNVESGGTAEAVDQTEVGRLAGGPPPNQTTGAGSEDSGGETSTDGKSKFQGAFDFARKLTDRIADEFANRTDEEILTAAKKLGLDTSEWEKEKNKETDWKWVDKPNGEEEGAKVVSRVPPAQPPGMPPTNFKGSDSNPPNLYVNVLSSDVVKDISKRAGEVLKQLGIAENPLLPPHEQIMKALAEQPEKVQPAAVAAVMREQGITGEDLVKSVDEAAANAGRTLQALQQADAHWQRVIKENPEWSVEAAKQGLHAFGAGPRPEAVLKEGLRSLQSSALGRSIWRRSGDLIRKTFLTRFSTASNNAVSTLPRIPLDLVDGLMTGAAMGMLDPAKWAGASDASIAEGAKAGALAGAQASMRVAMAFPDAAKKVLRMGETASTDFNDMVITQMEKLHPDLHSKLEGMSTGLEGLKESNVKIDKLKELLPYLNDAEKQKKYAAQLDLYQKRYDSNHALAGKIFNKVNWTYDQFLKPGNVQEFFFRRPYFVGALAKRAAAAGFDLNQLAQNAATLRDFANDPAGKDAVAITQLSTLADLPPEVWEAAADDALTFTYAYAPHAKGHGPVETFIHHYIKFMDALGPIGAVVDAFPKAIFNGLKFAYEYSPVGMIKPLVNITDEVYQGGGRKDIKYDDVSRVSKAVLGTAMFAAAIGVRKELGGEEWWQIKTGKKDKKGQPIYLNAKKYMPFAGMLYLADLTLRMKDGRLQDRKPGDDLAELYLGARRADSGGTVFSESIKEISDYIASGDPLDDRLANKAKKPVGQLLGAPLTPFLNLRDLVAQFDKDEAAKRDMKERPLLGPAIDKLPWLRSNEKYGLPLYQPPTEPAPQPSSAAPALTELGVSLDPGTNFATREFARLGISPIRWLKPDSDPAINRAQYAAYAEILGELAKEIERDPSYRQMSDAEKAAQWEQLLSGTQGFASMARKIGEQANPEEISKRALRRTQGPLTGKASGLDKAIKEMKNTPVP